ncbi:MAG: hypothetical protein U0R64_03850 [Candidatus Nanopelagicales bacterium]
MMVLLRYRGTECAPLLDDALAVLAAVDGFEHGWVGRSPDDPDVWILGSRWRDAGALRRGLGGFEAKMALGPLQGFSTGDDIVVEVLVDRDPTGVRRTGSLRADDADLAGPVPRAE